MVCETCTEGLMLAFEFVAVLAATVFADAAIYISLVEHPARTDDTFGLIKFPETVI